MQHWIEQTFDNLKYTSGMKEVHFNCPYCSDTRRRCYLNLTSYKFYCHNCNQRGNILNLIQYVEHVSYGQAQNIYKEYVGNPYIQELQTKDITEVVYNILHEGITLAKRPIPLPDDFKLVDIEQPTLQDKRIIKYLNSRGITKKQIKHHSMGYSNEPTWRDRVIIPIIEKGNTNFYVGRALTKYTKLKEVSPKNEDYQISKSMVLFNLDTAVDKYNSIVLCEGIFDALSFGDIGVSMLGKTMYDEQYLKLLDYRGVLDTVYICLDYDAQDKALEMAEKLSQNFTVKLIRLPKELDDPNNVIQKYGNVEGKKVLYKYLSEAEDYNFFTKLKAIL